VFPDAARVLRRRPDERRSTEAARSVDVDTRGAADRDKGEEVFQVPLIDSESGGDGSGCCFYQAVPVGYASASLESDQADTGVCRFPSSPLADD